MRKKDTFFNKLVKKDYNNELEKSLETKNFKEDVKSILLSILNKLEGAYKDYQTVKQDVETKEEFIKRFINQIEENCDKIQLVKPNSKESEILGNKTFIVDKNNKEIICYPIERKLMYCISKISKKDEIIKEDYFIINKTLSSLLNVGNSINQVEPMRDFNGYSWTTIPKEMESIYHNLIYQNMRILLGTSFMNDWIYNKEYIIDYMELLKNDLSKKYEKVDGLSFIEILSQLSVLIEVRYNGKSKDKILQAKREVDEELDKTQNSQIFINKITKEREELTQKIKYLEETLNNNERLKEEYIKRNELLPLEKKIFSVKVLSKMLDKEKEKYLQRIAKLNNMLSPRKYINFRKDLEEKGKYLLLLDTENIDNEIERLIIEAQKEFLRCYYTKLNKAQTKHEIIKLIYEFRYYCMIPFNSEKHIYEVKQLQKRIERIERVLIQRAGELKAVNVFSKDEEINYKMVKNIFNSRIINLEELCIKLTKEKEKLYIQLFDDNVFEEKTVLGISERIKNKDLEIRFNKKVKIFL